MEIVQIKIVEKSKNSFELSYNFLGEESVKLPKLRSLKELYVKLECLKVDILEKGYDYEVLDTGKTINLLKRMYKEAGIETL